MSLFTFKLPDIGEGIAECEIATWRVALGDTVQEDQPLVDMLTDKAAVEIPSPVAGVVKELRGAAGDKVAVGAVLMVIDTASAALTPEATSPSPTESAVASAAAGIAPQASTPQVRVAHVPDPMAGDENLVSPVADSPSRVAAAQAGGERPLAAPSVRKRAREMGIDLATVAGSLKSGRVGHADLEAHMAGKIAHPSAAGLAPVHGLQGSTTGASVNAPDIEPIKIIGLRRKIAESMQRSKRNIPHFAYVEEVDVTELEALRVHLNAGKRPEQAKLTLLPFLMRALVKAVPQFPNVNGTYDDAAGVFHRHTALHVGVAAQTPQGLMVPVVRHAERLDLWASAAELKRVSEAAKSGKAKREELTGSSITISSLGTLGGIVSTPIINAPEVAIVGVNKMLERPVVKNGQIVVRTMMNLSSSFDHRIVDGHDAASFIQRLKQLLEHPATLFMP